LHHYRQGNVSQKIQVDDHVSGYLTRPCIFQFKLILSKPSQGFGKFSTDTRISYTLKTASGDLLRKQDRRK
jgi:hypothetical protein